MKCIGRSPRGKHNFAKNAPNPGQAALNTAMSSMNQKGKLITVPK